MCGETEMDLIEASLDFLVNKVGPRFSGFEEREGQTEMLRACARSVAGGGCLLAEAGTGTGKTFAYLIPIVLSGKKAVISTRTKNLQEQLVRKDLAFLSSLTESTFAIAKGRGNYLCTRRLNAMKTVEDGDVEGYRRLLLWTAETDTGDLETLAGLPYSLWEKVCADADACRGQACGFYRDCFYFRARRRWERAQIVVSNHALTVLNAMIPNDTKILPQADVLVLDEAHSLDQVLSDMVGITLARRTAEQLFSRLLRLDERGSYRGLLASTPALFRPTESLRQEISQFWSGVKAALGNRETISGTFARHEEALQLSSALEGFVEEARTSVRGLFDEDQEIEVKAALMKLAALSEGLGTFALGAPGYVRWSEIEGERTALRMAPLYPREFMADSILGSHESVILTSATLSVNGDFSMIKAVLGVEGASTISVASPFDMARQVTIAIRGGIDLKAESGIGRLAEAIVEEASRADGGILVLFTSREVMKKCWDLSSEGLRSLGLKAMLQGELPHHVMLDTMRGTTNSVIFGLDSFWEGVDVRGDSLKCLVITKLPFEVPAEPMVRARTEEIEKRGGKPFLEYSLPRAVLKFRQGFGRLIRSRSDTGRVVICDERVRTMWYGKTFLKSIS